MNAEQKQRAIKLITYWRNRSITTMPEEYFVSGDCMTDLLQELIDAPEPEPVGYTNETELDYVRKYEALPVSGTFWPTSDEDACVALYTAPPANNQSEQHLEMVNTPAPSVPDGWRLVPYTPTVQMLERAAYAVNNRPQPSKYEPSATPAIIFWTAMLNYAPEAVFINSCSKPPKLSDERIREIWVEHGLDDEDVEGFARAIEREILGGND